MDEELDHVLIVHHDWNVWEQVDPTHWNKLGDKFQPIEMEYKLGINEPRFERPDLANEHINPMVQKHETHGDFANDCRYYFYRMNQ